MSCISLNCCYNSILFGIPDVAVQKLQLMKNSAARLVSNTGQYEQITPVFKALHWLPVRYRIHFQIIILTYKALHELAPPLQIYYPTRTLRSTR